ncbi:transcriptional regulator [Collinsella sp. An307]|nr:transcriptional regulator [Collinsella sp. An307]
MMERFEEPMIVLRLDRVLADRKIRSKDLAERVGLSETNLSRIKTGRVVAVRFSTLDALCRELNCKPGDILDYEPDEE